MPGSSVEELVVRRLLALYDEAELLLRARVEARLAEGIAQVGWTERKLAEVGYLRTELRAELAALEANVNGYVPRAMSEVYRDAAKRVERQLGAQVIGPITPHRAVAALEQSLTSGLTGTHFAILRQHEDVYRRIVAEAAEQGVIGVQTRDQLRRRMLDRFYEQGVRGFVDRRGRRWTLRSYTEMASRTAMAQAHLQGTVDRLGAHGIRLAKISDAPEECELCRPWEGKVVIVSGPRDGEHPTLDDAKSSGLFHPRCKHGLGAYIPELAGAKARQTPAATEGEPTRPLTAEEQAQLDSFLFASKGVPELGTPSSIELRRGLGGYRADVEGMPRGVPIDPADDLALIARDETGKAVSVLRLQRDTDGTARQVLDVATHPLAARQGYATALYTQADALGLAATEVSGISSLTPAGAALKAGRAKAKRRALTYTGEQSA